jgi:peptidoglycan-N-acetylglucosamine deacetylase
MHPFMYPYGVLAILMVLGISWFLLPHVVRRSETRRLARLCRRHRLIVLSFDDGPSLSLTPKVNDLLRQLGIRGSFFVIGNRVLEHPDLVKEVAAEGHEVGSHTARHLNAWKSLPLAHCRDMIEGQSQVVSLVGGTRLFRPPYGKLSLASLIVAKISNLSLAWWTIDPQDWLEQPRSHDEVLAEIRAAGGGVVLLHDFDRPLDDNHGAYVLQLIEKIAGLASREGLRFATFSDLVALGKDPVAAAGPAIGS